MELKKIIEDQENTLLHDNQIHIKPKADEVEVEQPLEDNDKVLMKKSDGFNHTPTSPLKTIKPILTCPSAPRKPKAAPLKKRKGLHNTALRLLDYSNDVLAMYPPAMLADFGNKVKKAKRSSGYNHHEQFKENISTNNVSYYTTKLQTKHV